MLFRSFIVTRNEVKIFKNELNRLGFRDPLSYNYTTANGEQVRSFIDPLLKKDKKTNQFKSWAQQQQRWKKLISRWHDDFYKQYKKKWDFQLKLYDYQTSVVITIKDDHISSQSKKSDIIARQNKHQELLKDFAIFLYDGFLNKKKGFGKCLYE